MAEESSAEKTEEATSHKIDEARKEGNVPKSVDMAGFIAMFAAVLGFVMFFGFLSDNLMRFFRYCTSLYPRELEPKLLTNIGLSTAVMALKMVLPLAVLVALFGAFGYVVQFGFLFTVKPLTPNIKKLNMIKGFGNLFSGQRFTDGLKITLKVSVALSVAGAFLWGDVKELPTVLLLPLGAQITWLLDKSLVIALVMLIVFFVFALIDISIVRYFHFKRLRMSKQEIRDEFKNIEGSPEVKARIRRIQIETSRRRMMTDIPSADVVVTNPTHFAVALRYKPPKDESPVVVAKGADLLAVQIKEIAREHHIMIVENPTLARELYRLVDIGRAIPPALHTAVAEVLAFVYKAQHRRPI